MSNPKITVRACVDAPIETVWAAWNTPEDIMQWNAASDDWHTTASSVDLRVGGVMVSRMEAKDGSMGFDFKGIYTQVVPNELIEFEMEDGRVVNIQFQVTDAGVSIIETFDAEMSNPLEMQQAGWQSILDNFVRHVESK